MKPQQIEYDPAAEYEFDMLAPEWEDTEDMCACGGYLKRCAVADGPEDYRYQYVCTSCGDTYES